MKKIIHVGILSVGLMLSNATLAETTDKFAHMRNSSNNMTTEQAEQVEAGSIKHIYKGGVWIGTKIYQGGRWVFQQAKGAYDAYNRSKYVKPVVETYNAYDTSKRVYEEFRGD